MNKKNTIIILSLVLGLAILISGGETVTAQVEAPSTVPVDQIIIKYKDSANLNQATQAQAGDQMQRLNDAAGVTIDYSRPMSGGAHVLRLAAPLSTNDAVSMAAQLAALSEVEYAQPDYRVFAFEVLSESSFLLPDDTRYPEQWHYFAPAAGNYGVNAPAAWNITTGSASVYVAVLDTGITDHADLAGRWIGGYDLISHSLIANDGDGRDNDPHDPGDWLTTADQSLPMFALCGTTNSTWHGTHVAGTIGATSNNSMGVAGLNWVSKVVPVRVLGKCGGLTSDIADGIRWAAGLSVPGVPDNPNPAKVINMSLGGKRENGCFDEPEYQAAVNDAYTAGSLIIVSAGNSKEDASFYVPASCDNVVAVASTDRYGDRAFYSNYGSVVEISAPGGAQGYADDPNGVLSTFNTGTQDPDEDSYAFSQGTSMAAPHVSGVASLMLSLNPLLTPDEVLSIMKSTVTAFPTGSTCLTSNCGSGIVNAAAALNAQPPIAPTLSPIDNLDGDGEFTVDWNDVVFADTYTLQEANNAAFSSPTKYPPVAVSQQVITGKTGGTWYYRVRAKNDVGESGWSNTVSVLVKPGEPILDPINNPGNTDTYTITWSTPAGADDYLLQEAMTNTFTSPITRYMGVDQQYAVTGQAGGTWYYRIRASNDAGDSGWSNAETITVTYSILSDPDVLPIVNPDEQSTFIVRWDDVISATSYILEGSSSPYFVNPFVEYSGPLTQTEVTTPMGGTWHYRTRAVSDTDQGPWGQAQSTFVQTIVYLPVTLKNYEVERGFNSQFNDHANGWETHLGNWILNGGRYQTKGTPKYSSSISYERDFAKFDYKVRMYRSGCTACSNRLLIHGTPGPLSSEGYWTKQYLFQYVMQGYFSVYQLVNGKSETLIGWTQSNAINMGAAWNTLRVVSVEGNLNFYINGSLEAWGPLDPTLTSGRVGIGMYRETADPNDLLMADWATLTTLVPSSSTTAQVWSNGPVDLDQTKVSNPDFFVP